MGYTLRTKRIAKLKQKQKSVFSNYIVSSNVGIAVESCMEMWNKGRELKSVSLEIRTFGMTGDSELRVMRLNKNAI